MKSDFYYDDHKIGNVKFSKHPSSVYPVLHYPKFFAEQDPGTLNKRKLYNGNDMKKP